jgi:hypothetical protein
MQATAAVPEGRMDCPFSVPPSRMGCAHYKVRAPPVVSPALFFSFGASADGDLPSQAVPLLPSVFVEPPGDDPAWTPTHTEDSLLLEAYRTDNHNIYSLLRPSAKTSTR